MATPRVDRSDDGHPVFIHDCTAGERATQLPLGPERWLWAGENTLTPSIHCTRCGTHGWWRDGDWVSA